MNMSNQYNSAREAIETDARGLEGVLLSLDLFQNRVIIIEMDASLVVKAVQSDGYPRAYSGRIEKKGG
jgi:hypothetical protein